MFAKLLINLQHLACIKTALIFNPTGNKENFTKNSYTKKTLLTICFISIFTEVCASRFAYVEHSDSNTISEFQVTSSGDLLLKAKIPNGIIDQEDWGIYHNGQIYYAVSWVQNSISFFKIDKKDGGLTKISALITGVYPWAVGITNNEKCAYLGNYGSNTISQYQIDQITGLFINKGEYNTRYVQPGQVTPTGDDKYVVAAFIASNTLSSYKVNPDCTLTATDFTATEGLSKPNRLRIINNEIYVVNDSNNSIVHYKIENNGSLTYKQSIVVDGVEPMGISQLNDEFIYLGLRKTNIVQAFKINTDGSLTKIGNYQTFGIGPRNIAFSSDKKHAYVANQFSNEITVFDVNEVTGELKFNKKINSEGIGPFGTSFLD